MNVVIYICLNTPKQAIFKERENSRPTYKSSENFRLQMFLVVLLAPINLILYYYIINKFKYKLNSNH